MHPVFSKTLRKKIEDFEKKIEVIFIVISEKKLQLLNELKNCDERLYSVFLLPD